MCPLATYHACHIAGIDLWTEDGTLRFRCPGDLPADLRDALSANKPALVALLVAEGVGQRDDYPSPEPKRFLIPTGCFAPAACSRLGWCERARATQRCGGTTR